MLECMIGFVMLQYKRYTGMVKCMRRFVMTQNKRYTRTLECMRCWDSGM
jgi:hypothetical protein